MRVKRIYFCKGCRRLHYDSDFEEEDGDLEIPRWNIFLQSVEEIKQSPKSEGEG